MRGPSDRRGPCLQVGPSVSVGNAAKTAAWAKSSAAGMALRSPVGAISPVRVGNLSGRLISLITRVPGAWGVCSPSRPGQLRRAGPSACAQCACSDLSGHGARCTVAVTRTGALTRGSDCPGPRLQTPIPAPKPPSGASSGHDAPCRGGPGSVPVRLGRTELRHGGQGPRPLRLPQRSRGPQWRRHNAVPAPDRS